MTRKEAAELYNWLVASYPRNYKNVDEATMAIHIDNLANTFYYLPLKDVLEQYKRVFATQKNEPHPSEIRAALKDDTRRPAAAKAATDPYEILRKHPQWDEMCHAYGERACRRAAKLCVVTASIDELKFQLKYDTPCREGKFHNY